jgi:hypothetical protein
MSDLNEVYIIAPKKDDNSFPTGDEVYNDRFYFSRSEAEHVIEEEFQTYMREKMAVYVASIVVRGQSAAGTFTLPPMNDVVAPDPNAPVGPSWEEIFVEQHELNPSANPADYYFQLDNNPQDGDYFMITPKAYFDKTGALLDMEDCVPSTVLPPGFDELSDSNYQYNGAAARGRFALLTNGLIEKKMV